MKPERPFVAERVAASHAAELLQRQGSARDSVRPAELLPALARTGDKLARALSLALAPLLGGQAPVITCAAPRESDAATLTGETPPLAANCLMAVGTSALPLLATADAAAVLRIVDRTFGGKGVAPAPLPENFSLSAEIMVKRIETILAAALGEALGAPGAVEPIARHGRLSDFEPFAEATPLAVLTLTIDEAGKDKWPLALALPVATLTALFGDTKQSAPRIAQPRVATPNDEPFCDVPLTISAVIVDMRIAMSALTNLQPGMVLPVSVARSVPLRIGDKTIAHGSIGAVDDRVAIQLTQSF